MVSFTVLIAFIMAPKVRLRDAFSQKQGTSDAYLHPLSLSLSLSLSLCVSFSFATYSQTYPLCLFLSLSLFLSVSLFSLLHTVKPALIVHAIIKKEKLLLELVDSYR